MPRLISITVWVFACVIALLLWFVPALSYQMAQLREYGALILGALTVAILAYLTARRFVFAIGLALCALPPLATVVKASFYAKVRSVAPDSAKSLVILAPGCATPALWQADITVRIGDSTYRSWQLGDAESSRTIVIDGVPASMVTNPLAAIQVANARIEIGSGLIVDAIKFPDVFSVDQEYLGRIATRNLVGQLRDNLKHRLVVGDLGAEPLFSERAALLAKGAKMSRVDRWYEQLAHRSALAAWATDDVRVYEARHQGCALRLVVALG